MMIVAVAFHQQLCAAVPLMQKVEELAFHTVAQTDVRLRTMLGLLTRSAGWAYTLSKLDDPLDF